MKVRKLIQLLLLVVLSFDLCSSSSSSGLALVGDCWRWPRVFDVRIIFGYKDARPARFVSDRYERNYLIEKLLSPCQKEQGSYRNTDGGALRDCHPNALRSDCSNNLPNNYRSDLPNARRSDCGFVRSRSDGELFLKFIKFGKSCRAQIQLRVVYSSVSPDDVANRGDRLQQWQTQWSEKAFLEGLEKADLIFYNGHSRGGGGPDFMPPLWSGEGHVDYSWYRRHHAGLNKMRQALTAAKSKTIGLFSCHSEKLKASLGANKDLQWLTTNDLVYAFDTLETMRKALSDWILQQEDPS